MLYELNSNIIPVISNKFSLICEKRKELIIPGCREILPWKIGEDEITKKVIRTFHINGNIIVSDNNDRYFEYI